jgi:G3E family GTPase
VLQALFVGSGNCTGWTETEGAADTSSSEDIDEPEVKKARYTDGLDSGLVREVLVALIRSKGFLWLASRPDAMLYWSVAGTHLEVTEKGKFCEDTTGIPKQELVFIFLQVKLQQSDASTQ